MTTINNNLVSIDTTVPSLSIGQVQLSADRRSTKEAPLSDAQRIRRAVLPAGHWGELQGSLNGTANQSLTDCLREALRAIGSDRLRDTLSADPMSRTVALADYTVPALLAWSADSASTRGSITFTREQVEAWFAKSATLASLLVKHAGKPSLPAIAKLAATRFATLAAKNHGLAKSADCDKLLALIDSADLSGSEASLVTEIVGRLDHIKKQLLQRESETTTSMDDL